MYKVVKDARLLDIVFLSPDLLMKVTLTIGAYEEVCHSLREWTDIDNRGVQTQSCNFVSLLLSQNQPLTLSLTVNERRNK